MSKTDTTYDNNARRRNMEVRLALEWLRQNRPDVVLTIKDLALKRFPTKYGRRHVTVLPTELTNETQEEK